MRVDWRNCAGLVGREPFLPGDLGILLCHRRFPQKRMIIYGCVALHLGRDQVH